MVFASDRLSDFLASTSAFEVDHVRARALKDGHVVEAPKTDVDRDELCLVVASGPRGAPERRRWTRQHAVRAQVGPYTVRGYLHSPPTIEPFSSAEHRTIVPLTSCVVEYARAGRAVRDTVDVALLVRSRISALTQISGLAGSNAEPKAP
jgi:hypothetical protein